MDTERLRTIVEIIDPWVWVVLGSIILVLLIIGVAIGWGMARWRRSRYYKQRFGPEYERIRGEAENPVAAEAELDRREQRVTQFDIRPLSSRERERFSHAWRNVQKDFVDHPSEAVVDADRLVAEVMEARGYPVGDFDQRAEDLSVDHPRVVDNYRSAREIAERNRRSEADTEELRQALVHYRALFEDLLETDFDHETEAQRTAEAT